MIVCVGEVEGLPAISLSKYEQVVTGCGDTMLFCRYICNTRFVLVLLAHPTQPPCCVPSLNNNQPKHFSLDFFGSLGFLLHVSASAGKLEGNKEGTSTAGNTEEKEEERVNEDNKQEAGQSITSIDHEPRDR